MWQRIALVGFSGTGKSTTARLLAGEIGWRVIDLDDDLEQHFGMTIPDVFATRGEAEFRQVERDLLAAATTESNVVVATGGGAPAEESAWSAALLGHPGTLTVALDADPETSYQRLLDQHAAEGEAVLRPMLAGDDPLGRIASLKAKRQQAYDRARLTLPVDRIRAKDVAAEIASLIRAEPSLGSPSVALDAPGGQSSILIESGILRRAGALIRQRYPKAGRVWIITDANVGPLHEPALRANLETAGFGVESVTLPSGESTKSIAGVSSVYDALLGARIERRDVVIALGGGVIGDLAGFAAATVLRGVGLVQIPTSLLAMVDSSIGGKTGINHPTGKNLIGSFYQPPLVLIDPAVLQTLPPRELNQGWAEVIKHAVIQPSTPGGEQADLLSLLERNQAALQSLSEPAISYVIRRNVALKARVVEADEREAGIRAFLNFGHTLGHAIEASDYALLHGEAVALGLRAAGRLSVAVNGADQRIVDRMEALLDAWSLPRTTSIDVDRTLGLLQSDKKRVAGEQRWVLMKAGGGVEIRTGVSDDAVLAALRSVAT
ncbi:MAG: 3-dehydroquinate synthase [Thermomicrobiales bacterium]|nr:3-dehydroquinate synthase [Thermomicrobiales bacterium]